VDSRIRGATYLVIDHHHRGLAGGLRVALVVLDLVRFAGLLATGRRPLRARLGLHLRCAGGDDSLAPREVGELLQLALAEDRRGREPVAALRHGRDDVEAERLHEPSELGQVGAVLDVAHPRELHADEDRQRTRRRCRNGRRRHAPACSTSGAMCAPGADDEQVQPGARALLAGFTIAPQAQFPRT
jgi:hypothetical protein